MEIPATKKHQEIIWALFYHRRNANEIATYLARPYNEIRKETDFFSRIFFAKAHHDKLSPSSLIVQLKMLSVDIVDKQLVKPLIKGLCTYEDLGVCSCVKKNEVDKNIFCPNSLSKEDEEAITLLHRHCYPVSEICRALPHLKAHRIYSFIKYLKATYNPHQLTTGQTFARLLLSDMLSTKVYEQMAIFTE